MYLHVYTHSIAHSKPTSHIYIIQFNIAIIITIFDRYIMDMNELSVLPPYR